MADLSEPRGVADLTAEEREFRDDAALAVLSGVASQWGAEASPAALAAWSYNVADAMLAARVTGSKEPG